MPYGRKTVTFSQNDLCSFELRNFFVHVHWPTTGCKRNQKIKISLKSELLLIVLSPEKTKHKHCYALWTSNWVTPTLFEIPAIICSLAFLYSLLVFCCATDQLLSSKSI